MVRRIIAVFCMPETGHVRRILPLVTALVRSGDHVVVFTHARYERDVRRAGGDFFDLFSRYPIEDADDASIPSPCRYVSFAAHYAEPIRRDVAALRPALVAYDTFAVIGPVVARSLGLPYVNVCAGHDVQPSVFVERFVRDPRTRVAPVCERAAERLRDEHGIADASPFSFLSQFSPHLNLYGEPPEFLDESARRTFEPVAFLGSVERLPPPRARKPDGTLRVYASFGTVVWRYFAREALATLHALAAALAGRRDARLLISTGRAELARADLPALASLAAPNVTVEPYVDQWEVLAASDVLVTHNGLNSTHEAIAHRVPMLSFPFFWDQPALARRCQEFDLALPLARAPLVPPRADEVPGVLEQLEAARPRLAAGLERAVEWERRVIDARDALVERVHALL